MRITDLRLELSTCVRNQNLKPENVKPLLEIMMAKDAPYINSETKNGSERYFITLLGKQAYKKILSNDVLAGYWKVVSKTQQPGKKVSRKRER